MVKITITAAGKPKGLTKKLPLTVDLADKTTETATVEDVKKAVAAKFPKLYLSRQKLSLAGEKKALADKDTLARAGVADGAELNLKDLGPQLGWRFVYIVEYIGPLILHPIFYFYPRIFYGGNVQHSLLQKYVFGMVMFHFIKRELETIFVHRFSHGTMPFFNIFKNSAHYHILSGLFLAFAIYRPKYSSFSPYIVNTKRNSMTWIWCWTAVFIFAELSNLSTHLTLRDLRPAGTTKRAIPYGYGFSLVSCPNYFFESVVWLAIAALTGSRMAWSFYIVGTVTMFKWAIKRHKAYKAEFGSAYPKNRKIMFPFIY